MQYDNPDPGNVSMKRPPAGQYPAVLVGVCYLGLQESQYGSRPQVMLRWEVHNDDGSPILDESGKVLAASQMYNATIKNNLEGKPSTLARVLNAHGINTSVGSRVDSSTWAGKAALVTIERSSDDRFSNVVDVNPLDDDEMTLTPFSALEHWEPQPNQQTRAKNPPPPWAEWKIGRSTDINHLASDQFRKPSTPQQGQATGGQPGRAPAPRGYSPTPAVGNDEDDIPF